MIDLFTGNPGGGKTLLAVSELAALFKQWEKDGTTARAVYVWGIKGLTLPHNVIDAWPLTGKKGDEIPVDSRGLPTCALAMDFGEIPDGSLVIIDEAQYLFPMRGPSVGQPVHSKFLNTHRHAGLDIWLITQHPKNLDNGVRRLVNKHRHIRRVFGWNRAVIYEWAHCEDGLQGLKHAVMVNWTYPKKTFALYKSAEIHTKQAFKKPWWMWLPVLMIPVAVWAVPRVWDTVVGVKSGNGIVPSKKPAEPPPRPAQAQPLVTPSATPAAPAPVAPASSAPAPAKFAGCVSMRGACKCIDTAGEPVDKEPSMCLDIVGANRPEKLAEIPASLKEHHPPPPPKGWVGWAPDTAPRRTGSTVADVVAAFR
ncbi:hypothetical protein RD110_10295 [Rhodoferax koreense]|uniref:Zona occludens toxin N-terminal domain-containing protein n=1 Tax=Rhodoferax koreensis TaxID=1842727 RepID=A0A1P8JUU3_9BURK|nr:zonular occludens toxin domain-containing protein [Rhodoferax koreense]APW37529.1 hypothetical protein RD110_10295 [Rhodoferax koreense]